ncbi:PREDICTED: uncharacterized protein LOC109115497 [Nelumbo nucifera]|uniref:Uncharacterized protein LOC109115497 n=1 Tax=Nelumbo nucifera TaxID=4432 RepID=A0A1U8QAS0_NELNU|nr:PREDICTED: uncharacterized protein LOC109115497 [Nelumbo nucifera]
MLKLGFQGLLVTLLYSSTTDTIICVLVYVDDIIVTGNKLSAVQSLISDLSQCFALKDLGDLQFFLGIQVSHSSGCLFLSQRQYLIDLLQKAELADAKAMKTPLVASSSLSRTDGDLLPDPTMYRSLVGSLQYLTLTRTDIAFAVNKTCQFLSSPTTAYWAAMKWILRYLKGTLTHGLQIRFSPSCQLQALSDTEWAGCPLQYRSAKKQHTIARSSTEAKLRAIVLAVTEVIWVQQLHIELKIVSPSAPIVWCDNAGSLYLAANPVFKA